MTGFCDDLDLYVMSDPVMSNSHETEPGRSETVRIKGI